MGEQPGPGGHGGPGSGAGTELRVAKAEHGENHVAQRGVDSSAGDAVQREERFEAHSESSSVAVEQGSPVPQQGQSADAITDRLSQALLAQQLPTIPKFTGEECQQEGEIIEDWKEQFEMVATLGEWDERSKLVNLVMHPPAWTGLLILSFLHHATTIQLRNSDGGTSQVVHPS